MTGLLKDLTPRTFCMDGDCTVRYYGKDGGMALGIIRTNKVRKEGRVPQDIIMINSMELNNLIEYVMSKNNLPVDMGEVLVNTIKSDVILLVNEHFHDNTAHIE